MRAFASLIAVVLSALAIPAFASVVPKPLLGLWNEKGENGAIQWKLEPEKISVTPVDAAGVPIGETSELDVLYQAVSGGWAVVIRAADGAPLGEGSAELKDNQLVLMLPGIGPHLLERASARPAARAPGKKSGAKAGKPAAIPDAGPAAKPESAKPR